MSDLKSFFGRWSRRKRAAQTVPQARHTSPCKGEVGDHGVEPGAPGGGQRQSTDVQTDPHPTGSASLRETNPVDPGSSPGQALPLAGGGIDPREPAFDLTKLPPIESITAETDIRAFLAPGVPVELSRAALRRAWSADPRIRGFVGLSENSWDFNAAGAIPGFGPLEMTDELRRHVEQLLSPKVAGDDPTGSASLPNDRREQRRDVEESVHSQETLTEPSSQPSVSLGRQMASPASPSEQDPPRDPTVGYPTNSEAGEIRPPASVAKKLHGRALPK